MCPEVRDFCVPAPPCYRGQRNIPRWGRSIDFVGPDDPPGKVCRRLVHSPLLVYPLYSPVCDVVLEDSPSLRGRQFFPGFPADQFDLSFTLRVPSALLYSSWIDLVPKLHSLEPTTGLPLTL